MTGTSKLGLADCTRKWNGQGSIFIWAKKEYIFYGGNI
jgi:hypothetical protein